MFEIYSLRAETEVKLDWPNLPTTPAVMLAWLILTLYFIISVSAKKFMNYCQQTVSCYVHRVAGRSFKLAEAHPTNLALALTPEN